MTTEEYINKVVEAFEWGEDYSDDFIELTIYHSNKQTSLATLYAVYPVSKQIGKRVYHNPDQLKEDLELALGRYDWVELLNEKEEGK